MRALRRILGDRLSGGVVAALAGYFLLLQAFVAALACGMTVPVEAGPRFVICHAAEAFGANTSAQDEEPSGFSYECPCVICHAADGDLTVALAPGADLGPAFALRSGPLRPSFEANGSPVDPSALGLAPGPRGPPSVSA